MKWFKITIISLLSLFILAALILETGPGKRLIQKALVQALHRSSLQIEVGQIGGHFPQEIEAKEVRIPGVVSIETLRFKLSLLALLGGSLEIAELRAEGVQIFDEQKLESDLAAARKEVTDFPRIPLTIDVRHYRLTAVQWKDWPLATIEGSALLHRSKQSIDLAGKMDLENGASLRFAIKRNRAGKIDADFTLHSPTPKPEGTIEARAHLRGTRESLTGTVNGKFLGAPNEKAPWLAREWAFKSRVKKERDHPIALQKLIVTTQGLKIAGSATVGEKASLVILAHFEDKQFLGVQLPIETQGVLLAHANVTQNPTGLKIHSTWQSGALKVDGVELEEPSGVLDGLLEKDWSFQGVLDAKARSLNTDWTLNTELIYHNALPERALTFDHFLLHSDLLGAEGTLTLVPGPLWIGNVSFHHAHGELLQAYWPSLEGLADGNVFFFANQGEQEFASDITARRLKLGALSVGSAHITSDRAFNITAELERIQWKKAKLDSIAIESAGGHFVLRADSKWLALGAEGEYSRGSITLQQADGLWLNREVHLAEPSTLTWGPNQFAWDNLSLRMGTGTIDARFAQEEKTRDAKIDFRNIPIDVLTFHPMQNATVQGNVTGSAVFKQVGDDTDADWHISMEDGQLEEWGPMAEWLEKEPVKAKANMEGSLHHNHIHLKTDIQLRDRPYFDFDGKMPLKLDRKFQVSFPHGFATGYVKVQGELGDLFDFLNLGMHRIDGRALCDLTFSNGRVRGSCLIADGYYQNYVTGTELSHIQAELQGAEDKLLLTHFNAKDLEGRDVLSATGEIRFSLKHLFPFHFDAVFDHLKIVQIDLVTASAEGHVSIAGDLKSALATGELTITESDISIPSHISRSYPDLQVVYSHKPIVPTVQAPPKRIYPLALDMKITAPKAIFINGRGLNSEWNGDFAIGGTYAEPSVTGSLALLDGEFSFAGKRFKLSQGSLSLQGNQYTMPLVDITATTTEKAITITARIKGPLNRPQLTFQSVPPLPLSAILSHLLFGKDLSDVTGLQALQLAGTVASVAGEGPDILEITRKSLGVDRLQIVMTPTKSGDGYENKETIALQVGKVLTPGVILTIKQSAYDSNPDVGIEVDLLHGFVLEVESEQQTEQGKFSLKWNKNY